MSSNLETEYKLRRDINELHQQVEYLKGQNNMLQSMILFGEKNTQQTVTKTYFHKDPLSIAAANDDCETLRVLIKSTIPETSLSAALFIACELGFIDVVRLLVEEAGCDPRCDYSSALLWACQGKYINIVEYLLDKGGCDVNTLNSLPLRIAVSDSNTKLVEMLIKHGAHMP